MTQTFTRLISGFLLMIGFADVGYIATQFPPYQSSGALDLLAVALLFLGLVCGLTGLCSFLALWLHRRWPALSGAKVTKKNSVPRMIPATALRQGFLASVSLCAIILFSMLQILDSIFIFVVFLLAGLIEAYFQSLSQQI